MKNIFTLTSASIVLLSSVNVVAATSDANIESIYNSKCAACHVSGAAGSPVVGNKEQWENRIAKGRDSLIDVALNGSKVNPVMQAKGGFSDLTDEEVIGIVDYMIKKSE
jgi:cytochrome c5